MIASLALKFEDIFTRSVDKSVLEHSVVIEAENGQGKRQRATTAE